MMIPREPEEEQITAEEPKEEQPEIPEETLEEAKERAATYLANWQRTQADFINYKRRSEQERVDIGRFANAQLMLSILPVLDDLERAFDSITPQVAELDWVEGIRLIERKLRTALESQGLSRIKALGEPFDPNFHEAAGHAKGREGIVALEIEKGYMLHDRVLRPAKVMVGDGEIDEEEESQ
jgi:molecular chaperone GrpE